MRNRKPISTGKIAQFLNVPHSRVDAWIHRDVMELKHSQNGSGNYREWVLEDIVAAKIIHLILEYGGVFERARHMIKAYRKKVENAFSIDDHLKIFENQYLILQSGKQSHYMKTTEIEDLIRNKGFIGVVIDMKHVYEEVLNNFPELKE